MARTIPRSRPGKAMIKLTCPIGCANEVRKPFKLRHELVRCTNCRCWYRAPLALMENEKLEGELVAEPGKSPPNDVVEEAKRRLRESGAPATARAASSSPAATTSRAATPRATAAAPAGPALIGAIALVVAGGLDAGGFWLATRATDGKLVWELGIAFALVSLVLGYVLGWRFARR
jgi:hypothetical protein